MLLHDNPAHHTTSEQASKCVHSTTLNAQHSLTLARSRLPSSFARFFHSIFQRGCWRFVNDLCDFSTKKRTLGWQLRQLWRVPATPSVSSIPQRCLFAEVGGTIHFFFLTHHTPHTHHHHTITHTHTHIHTYTHRTHTSTHLAHDSHGSLTVQEGQKKEKGWQGTSQ